jgi:hypothetical protein
VRPSPRILLALGLSLAALGSAAPARADISSWVFFGGGALVWKQATALAPDGTKQVNGGGVFSPNGTITMDAGVGTTPDGPVIVGAFARIRPIIGHGTDLGVLARLATHGFQAGRFGVAFDAGFYGRTWGAESIGFEGGVTLGAPLGFTLSLLAQAGTDNALGFGASLGIDVLRLTIYRQALLDRWPNAHPAWTKKSASIGPGLIRF